MIRSEGLDGKENKLWLVLFKLKLGCQADWSRCEPYLVSCIKVLICVEVTLEVKRNTIIC